MGNKSKLKQDKKIEIIINVSIFSRVEKDVEKTFVDIGDLTALVFL